MIRTPSRLLLRDDAISLREITRDDTDFVVSLRNHPEVRSRFTNSSLISTQSHAGFLARYFSEGNSEEIYLIESHGERVGMISLYNIGDARAEWGRIAIEPDRQGAGYGKRALRLIIARAGELGVETLYCHVKADNHKAIGLYQSLGFTGRGLQEGELYMELSLKEQ